MDTLEAMETLTKFFNGDPTACAGPKEKDAWNKVRNTMTEMLGALITIGRVSDKDFVEKVSDIHF